MNILNYLQVFHNYQRYNQMVPYLYGPAVDKLSKTEIEENLSDANFGYELKFSGIKPLDKTNWSLTYSRTILGTNETFKIKCALINDTCRVYVDSAAWNVLFNRKIELK